MPGDIDAAAKPHPIVLQNVIQETRETRGT